MKVKVEPSGTTDVTIKQEPEDSSPADQTAQSQDGKAEEGSEENQEVEVRFVKKNYLARMNKSIYKELLVYNTVKIKRQGVTKRHQ